MTDRHHTLKNTFEVKNSYKAEYLPVSAIKTDLKHPRKTTPKQINKAAAFMAVSSWIPPIVIDQDTAKGGNQIRWQMVKKYDEESRFDDLPLLRIVHSWDTAVTAGPNSDYSVCTIWGYSATGKWFLLDLHRVKLEFSALERKAVSLIEGKWKPDAVVIEYQGAGMALHDKLRERYYVGRIPRGGYKPHIYDFNPRVSKEERFHIHKYKLEEGEFYIPKKAPWLADFSHEFKTFPAGKHDDQVDSTIQFLAFLEMHRGRALLNMGERRRIKR